MNYACLAKQQYDFGAYRLVPLRHEDTMDIKRWRNAQISVLRQKEPLTDAMQEAYYRDVVTPLFKEKQPQQVLFSYLLDGKCIGYGALVRIDWQAKQAEVSFLVDPARAADEKLYQQDFGAYLHLLKEVAFHGLQLKRLYTETFDIRPLHVSILESQGFVFEKRLKDHVVKDGKTLDSIFHGCTP